MKKAIAGLLLSMIAVLAGACGGSAPSSTPQASHVTGAPASSMGIYRAASLGYAVEYDTAHLSVNSDRSSPLQVFVKEQALPMLVSKEGMQAAQDSLVVFAANGWSDSSGASPPALAVVWREPSNLTSATFKRLASTQGLRVAASAMEAALKKSGASEVKVTPTHAPLHNRPALAVSMRATSTSTGNTSVSRWLFVYTPTSMYGFYGYCSADAASTYLPLYEHMTHNFVVFPPYQ
ncbi:MAG TPA: hypothetical protein VMK12_05435 [Anaeromyxobacteraceae bacterium]|nr:hypothetical protein [Anaeromyxobacteraceae bacterium]